MCISCVCVCDVCVYHVCVCVMCVYIMCVCVDVCTWCVCGCMYWPWSLHGVYLSYFLTACFNYAFHLVHIACHLHCIHYCMCSYCNMSIIILFWQH